MIPLIHPSPSAVRRLLWGLIASLAFHTIIASSIAPKSTHSGHYAPQSPLQVELRHDAAPQNAVEVVSNPSSELFPRPAGPETTREALPNGAQQPASAVTEAPIQLALPLDRYYTAREIDIRAEPINEVDLVYPQLAYQRRIRGKVELRLFINERGAIDEISLVRATPAGTFEEAALAATLALQFKPAVKNGRNVKSQKTIEVEFDPYKSINTP